MTGPQDPAAGGDRFLAGDADREQALEALKEAFVQGRLTTDELDVRAGRALSARTRADLAVLTGDIPHAPEAPTTGGPAKPPTPVRRRPMARAAVQSGSCLVVAAAVLFGGIALSPDGPGADPNQSWGSLALFLAISAVVAALGFLGHGVATAVEQRSSRRHLPPGPGGHAPQRGLARGTGRDADRPGRRADDARVDLQAHRQRQRRRQGPASALPSWPAPWFADPVVD